MRSKKGNYLVKQQRTKLGWHGSPTSKKGEIARSWLKIGTEKGRVCGAE